MPRKQEQIKRERERCGEEKKNIESYLRWALGKGRIHYNALQHTATHCNTLQQILPAMSALKGQGALPQMRHEVCALWARQCVSKHDCSTACLWYNYPPYCLPEYVCMHMNTRTHFVYVCMCMCVYAYYPLYCLLEFVCMHMNTCTHFVYVCVCIYMCVCLLPAKLPASVCMPVHEYMRICVSMCACVCVCMTTTRHIAC